MPDRRSTDEPLAVRIHRRNGVVRVLLSGALDIAGAARLEAELRGLASDPVDGVLLDARDVTFIDSMGLRALLQALPADGGDGPPAAVIGMSPPVERLLTLTGTRSVLERPDGFELLKRFSDGEAD